MKKSKSAKTKYKEIFNHNRVPLDSFIELSTFRLVVVRKPFQKASSKLYSATEEKREACMQ